MFHAVLGEKAVIHGLDINPNCVKFVDAKTSITIGDQEDPEMWQSFFTHVTPSLDFLVDDGGHHPNQMLQTTYSVYPKLNAGGVLAIEDIHGASFLQPFWVPLGHYVGAQPDVASVHVYPYHFVVQKTSTHSSPFDPTLVAGATVSQRITSLEEVDAALAAAQPGSLVVLENAAWGRFINPDGLASFFTKFIDLQQPVDMPNDPPGCWATSSPVCTVRTVNSVMQSRVFGLHILPTKMVVEVPLTPPVIVAIRRGDQWIRRPELDEISGRLEGHMQGSGAHAAHYPPAR